MSSKSRARHLAAIGHQHPTGSTQRGAGPAGTVVTTVTCTGCGHVHAQHDAAGRAWPPGSDCDTHLRDLALSGNWLGSEIVDCYLDLRDDRVHLSHDEAMDVIAGVVEALRCSGDRYQHYQGLAWDEGPISEAELAERDAWLAKEAAWREEPTDRLPD